MISPPHLRRRRWQPASTRGPDPERPPDLAGNL